MIKFVVENERVSMVGGKNTFKKKIYNIFCYKSPLEDAKVRRFKSKIALVVQYTPCDHKRLMCE